MTLTRWILCIVPVCCSMPAAKGILHYFQLESYQFPGFFRTVLRNKIHAWLPGLIVTAISLLLCYGYDLFVLRYSDHTVQLLFQIFILPLSFVLGQFVARQFSEKRVKKSFVCTNRIKRLFFTLFVIMTGLSACLAQSSLFILQCVWPLLLPMVIALAGLLAWPAEKLISELYFRDARRKLLSNPRLIRIGITGSYGKTSVKHILGAILSEKFPTLITPASYNTPMGVTRTIREKLTPSHKVFIGEMGARHVGDIREMCRLVRPAIGILTSIGSQHLDTFKTLERIAETKFELMESLPQKGHGYFFDDRGLCKNLYNRMEKPKTLAGTVPGESDCWCTNVSVSSYGCRFDLTIAGKGTTSCQTLLLGEHNIHNILLAAAVASDLGLTLKQISHGISKLQPVKNRLELISRPGSFTIINDAFNSNPAGAKAALQVLSSFPKRRIVITPGMVELGSREAKYNQEFGNIIAQAADIAIVIGRKHVLPIIRGMLEGGFTREQIHQVTSLEESTAILHNLVLPSDTVLYENDLPDQYQEV